MESAIKNHVLHIKTVNKQIEQKFKDEHLFMRHLYNVNKQIK
jgi:hypothetical protein